MAKMHKTIVLLLKNYDFGTIFECFYTLNIKIMVTHTATLSVLFVKVHHPFARVVT